MKAKKYIDIFLSILRIRAIYTGLKIMKIIQFDYGHFQSSNSKESVNNEGPVPWFTYPAISFLEQLNLRNMIVLEYGSGNSTLYWSKRCKEIVSVEDNHKWINELEKRELKSNITILFKKTKTSYVNPLKEPKRKFDIIVIDGSYRYSCTKTSISRLNKNGIIIIDNSDQYPRACELLRKKGFIQADMCGFGPINPNTWCTSFFFSRDYSFKPRFDKQPTHPIGAIKKIAES